MLEQAQFRIEIWRTDTVLAIARESMGVPCASLPAGLVRRAAFHAFSLLLPLLALPADLFGRGQLLRLVALRA